MITKQEIERWLVQAAINGAKSVHEGKRAIRELYHGNKLVTKGLTTFATPIEMAVEEVWDYINEYVGTPNKSGK